MRKWSTFILSFLTFSCTQTNNEISRYHEDGMAKPTLAVASMIDTTSFDCPWSLSEEFTATIAHQLGNTNVLYVQAKEEAPFVENPFGQDLSWIKREFRSHEFALFLELVEHERVPEKKGAPLQEASTNLNVGVRLRVIDLRGPSPKIVLQEMVRSSYFIPKSLLPVDYSKTVWGSEEYRKTPMGLAHASVVQEIVSRVTDYVLLAKSR